MLLYSSPAGRDVQLVNIVSTNRWRRRPGAGRQPTRYAMSPLSETSAPRHLFLGRASSASNGSEHQTTNLGVRSSNLFGRAST